MDGAAWFATHTRATQLEPAHIWFICNIVPKSLTRLRMLYRRVLYLLASNALLVSSQGWAPNAASQAAPANPVPSPSSSGSAGASPTDAAAPFDWSKLLTTGPVASLFELAGVNITEKWNAAQKATYTKPYDTRVPMITDDNYDELIKKGDPEDTWFMIVYVELSEL